MKTGEEQYLALARRIIDEGKWVTNERTGKRCLTVIGDSLYYDCRNGELPLVTTRKSFWKAAIAEMLGYLRGYNSAAQFRDIGCNTWNANANENEAWLANPNRKGEDDMGYCYGEVGRRFRNLDGKTTTDQLRKIVDDLSRGYDDRREIMTFLHPGTFDLACLAPCMHTHTFSLLDGELYLNSNQRSIDTPLGLVFNMVQCAWLLMIMAQITGNKPATVKHDLVNIHIYEDQLELMRDIQLEREPFSPPRLTINPDIKSLEDLETWVTLDDFELEGYECHEPIKFPFAV